MEVTDFTKEEQEKIMAKYAQLAFSNLKKNIIQDLMNDRNESVIYKKYSKEEIVRMLENPQKNERKIRELSEFIYLVSSHYRRLVDYYSNILLYNYTIVPTKIPIKKPNKTQYKNDYYTIVNLAEKYNLKHESPKALKIAVRDGVFYGVYYESEDSFFIKSVPASICRIASIEDGVYRFSVDMAYFSGKEYLLNTYGQDFVNAYRLYKGDKEKGIKGDKKKKWYEVPNGVVILADESSPFCSLPVHTGLLLDILSIDDYKLLHKAKAENDNFKVLSAKMPLDENQVPVMSYEMMQKYYGQMAQNLPNGIGLLISPFDVVDFSFQDSTTATRNDVTEAVNTFWQGAGISPALMGGGNISSQGAMMLAVKPDEGIAFSMLQQFERFFNYKLKKLNLNNGFKISFMRVSIFNQDEYTNRLSKAAQYSVPVKMEYASALGMSPSDILGKMYLESLLELGTETWNTPLVSANTTSNTIESSSGENGGRPKIESGQTLTEAGEKTREQN